MKDSAPGLSYYMRGHLLIGRPEHSKNLIIKYNVKINLNKGDRV